MTDSAPETILLEFLDEDFDPIELADLGEDFLDFLGIDEDDSYRPFRIAIENKIRQAGNIYYHYSQNEIPLPSALDTHFKVENTFIRMGKIGKSKRNKNPMRESENEIVICNKKYIVKVYISETNNPYYVKVASCAVVQ